MPMWPADTPPDVPGQLPASSWDIQAPYAAGPEVHIQVHGDSDPGGSDKTSPTVAGAVAAAMARQDDLQQDTYDMGSTIGDLMALPAKTSDGSDRGGFYDPPRDY